MEKKFNPAQQKAIKALGNSVILAGAGSGKTTVLAERFLYLIEEKKVKVDQILTLTFTQKAAAEMRAPPRRRSPADSPG